MRKLIYWHLYKVPNVWCWGWSYAKPLVDTSHLMVRLGPWLFILDFK